MKIPFLSRFSGDESGPESTKRYDLVVIGMGSGGAVAAEFAASQLGLRVAAVERGRVGGDCLWTGCVPSKALIASAKAAHMVRHADRYAIEAGEPEVDLKLVWDRIKAIQQEIASTDDDPERIRATGVELIEGEARLVGPREVAVGDRRLTARFVLVCTGSRPSMPPIDGIDAVDVLTSENLFDIPRPPDSLVIIGGGPISCEIAQALNRLGVQVTIVEMEPRLLPRDDPQHAARLLETLRDEGVVVHLNSSASSVRKGGDGVNVAIGDDVTVTAQGLMVAAGRRANIEALDLDAAGVHTDTGRVVVDHRNRTNVPTIYAVGDVNTRPDFTHTAGYDAVLAVRDMFFPGRGVAPPLVPWCTFTDPEVAHVGLTEPEAVEKYGRRKVSVYREALDENDRARADSDTNGEIVIVTAGGRIVGGHAMCSHAGELIHELVVAVRLGLKTSDLTDVIHVYPTLSSTVGSLIGDAAYETARRLKVLAKLGRLLG